MCLIVLLGKPVVLRKLKVYSQILKKQQLGHGLSLDEVKLIEYFYHDNEFPRQCPGNLLLFKLTKGKLKNNKKKQQQEIYFTSEFESVIRGVQEKTRKL